MVRHGRLEDIPKLLEIGQWYLDQISPGAKIDHKNAPKDLRYLMNTATGCVLVAEVRGEIVGTLIGQVVKQSFVDLRFATDLAFVVMPGHPVQAVMLARQFIHWAKQQRNVREVTLQISSGLANVDRVALMYEKLGMRNMGACFTLQLPTGVSS